MFASYFAIAFRHLLKRKLFSLINILGLTIGIAAVFLIVQYVSFETSFDSFHINAERIYRVCHNRYVDGVIQYKNAQSFIPTGQALKNDFSTVDDYTTLFKISDQAEIIVTYSGNETETVKFSEDRVYHVKGNFFSIFTATAAEGKLPSGELNPKSVWISSSTAKKYFGDSPALNKIIHHSYNGDFKIAGVYEDFPQNSHFIPDFLFSWEPLTDHASGGDENNWHWDGFFTYILLKHGTTAGAQEENLQEVLEKYRNNDALAVGKSEFWLQPLIDIHLHSDLVGEAGANGNALMVTIFKSLALFILLIAYLNYINLSTARAIDRVKEIGVRKIIGSTQSQLAIQFISEASLVTAAAFATAVLVVYTITYVTPSDLLHLNPTLVREPLFWFTVALIAGVGCLASAIYPAFIISTFKPVNALKGKGSLSESRLPQILRRVMVTFQFVLAIFMITGSLIIYKQINFMKQRDLGMDIGQTLVLETFVKFGPPGSDSAALRKLDLLKENLLSNQNVAGVTASYDIPGKEHLSLFPTFRNILNSESLVSLYYSRIDNDFIPLFDVKVIAGRNFSSQTRGDESAIVINKEALEALGFDNADEAIGHEVMFGREPNLRKVTVIGVVDFRTRSFKEINLPVVYQTHWAPLRYLSIKLNDVNSLQEEIRFLEQQWRKYFPDLPFTYFFLDEYFDRQYHSETKFSMVLTLFTSLSVVIACLGLYGLASIVATQRTKEVGIRKVLGASVKNLFLMLSKDFGIMLVVATIIASPAVWYATTTWLDQYQHQTEISWWIFVLPLLVMAVIVFLTVSQHALRAALKNPIDSLRDE